MLAELANVIGNFDWTLIFLIVPVLIIGLVIGAIPGLTAIMAVALLVPITYTLQMDTAIALLVTVYVGGISGGLVSATLLNIPGTPASVCTTFEAYPMACKGLAGEALANGMFSSFIGTLLSFFPLLLGAQFLGRFALYLNAYEYLALVIFTLTCVIAISGKSLVKGFISAGIGLLMSTVGLSITDSIPRFTFDIPYLDNGFAMMPVLIGMYGITQVIGEIRRIGQPITVINPKFSFAKYIATARMVLRSWKNVIRSSMIGTFIGILPGVGSNIAAIMSYSQAKASSPHPETFGTGNPEGIIASETANNACCGGALVPLLTLGIPGDGATLMMMGAFMIHGVQPGPALMRNNMDIVAMVLLVFLIVAILLFFMQPMFIGILIKSLLIPCDILYPVIIVMCMTGCFALNSSMFDVWVFLLMGFFALLLIKLEIPILPLVLGLILGQLFELNLDAAWSIGDNSLWGFLDRPVSLIVLFLSLLSILYSLYKRKKEQSV